MISQRTKERLIAWWEHKELDRPCIMAYTPKYGAVWPEAPAPDDYWLKPDLLAGQVFQRARNLRYLGEAQPYLYIDYGACAVGLQMGAKGHWRSLETIWTDPCVDSADQVAGLHPGGEWKRIQDAAIARALELGKGRAMLSSYCLGAAADTTAALMGTENLLCAMMDEPDAVKRAFEAVKRETIALFERLVCECEAQDTLLSGWHAIWAPGPSTPIQEDFSYMIGPGMFDEFCLPHIRDMVDAVPYSFYHLDGIQALSHLPSLLKIPNLKVIQWQPGEGHSDILQWTEVIERILKGGKSCQVYVKASEVDELIKRVGKDGMLLIVSGTEQELKVLEEKYQLESNLM